VRAECDLGEQESEREYLHSGVLLLMDRRNVLRSYRDCFHCYTAMQSGDNYCLSRDGVDSNLARTSICSLSGDARLSVILPAERGVCHFSAA